MISTNANHYWAHHATSGALMVRKVYETRSNSRKEFQNDKSDARAVHGFGANGNDSGTNVQGPGTNGRNLGTAGHVSDERDEAHAHVSLDARVADPCSNQRVSHMEEPVCLEEYQTVDNGVGQNLIGGKQANFLFVILFVALVLCLCMSFVVNWRAISPQRMPDAQQTVRVTDARARPTHRGESVLDASQRVVREAQETVSSTGSDTEPQYGKNINQMEELYHKVDTMLSQLGAKPGALVSDKSKPSEDGVLDEDEINEDEAPISEDSDERQCHVCMTPGVGPNEADEPEHFGASFQKEDPQTNGKVQRHGLHDTGKSDPKLGLPLRAGSRNDEAPADSSPPQSEDIHIFMGTESNLKRYFRTFGDILYKWYTDPLGEFWRVVNGEFRSWRDQLSWISGLLGLILFITTANLLAWFMMRFADLVGAIWKFIKLMRFLPVFVIFWKFLSGLMRGLFFMLENMQEREKIEQKKNMERDVQSLKKELAELKKASEGSPSTSTAGGGRKKEKNPLEKQLYTRMVINGELYPRCMIDTGSDCNLFPTSLMTKNSIPFKKTKARGIRGFNDQVYETVAGEFTANVSFGPSKNEKAVHFYVVSGVPCPIIGCPLLKAFNISVDVGSHQIIDQGSGMIISCSSASIPPEKDTPKN